MIVRQAANVLEIMEFFAQTRKPATLAEIADHFGWPRSSTFNLLATLSEKGYLYEPRPRAGFYPTPRWLAMARMISEVEPLPPWTHTLIADLSAETGETASIVAPAGVMAGFIGGGETPGADPHFSAIRGPGPLPPPPPGPPLLLPNFHGKR